MPSTHVARAVIVGTIHGQETNNVLHFDYDGGATPDWAALAQAIIDCIFTTLRPAVSEDWKLNLVRVTQLYPQLSDPIEVIPAQTTQGTGLPAQASTVAWVMSVKTGLGGRTHRGRFYLAGVIENDVNLSITSDAALQKLIAFAACLAAKFITREGIEHLPYRLGVLSRKNATLNGVQNAFTPASRIIPDRIPGTMRSRRVGKGS